MDKLKKAVDAQRQAGAQQVLQDLANDRMAGAMLAATRDHAMSAKQRQVAIDWLRKNGYDSLVTGELATQKARKQAKDEIARNRTVIARNPRVPQDERQEALDWLQANGYGVGVATDRARKGWDVIGGIGDHCAGVEPRMTVRPDGNAGSATGRFEAECDCGGKKGHVPGGFHCRRED